jgi:hypothetical protein
MMILRPGAARILDARGADAPCMGIGMKAIPMRPPPCVRERHGYAQ